MKVELSYIDFLVVQSATLVDSDDGITRLEETTTQSHEESQQDAEISKLLLMKKLLSVRNQARALASTTFSNQRASIDSKNLQIEASDLHTAYRLPLHRLSDTQLAILLQKYADPEETNEQVSTCLNLISLYF